MEEKLSALVDGAFQKTEDVQSFASSVLQQLEALRSAYDSHDHAQYSLDGHIHAEYALAADVSNRLEDTKQTISILETETKIVQTQLVSDIQLVVQNTADLLKDLNDKINNHVSDLQDSDNELSLKIDRKVSALEVNSRYELGLVQKQLQTIILDKFTELDKTKSDKDHTHSQYAEKQHTHPDYANKTDVSILDRDLTAAHQLIARTASDIKAIIQTLSTKIDYGDALSQADLDAVSNKIKEQVLDTIVLPRDGKDSHEWIFQWHPSVKGRLMFRREDQKEWKQQDLLVKAGNPLASPAFGGMGGGAGADGSTLTVTKNDGFVVEGRVTEIDFIGLQVSKTGNGRVQVESIGSGGGGSAEPPYIAPLSGFQVTIPFGEHGKGSYSSVRVFNSLRTEVSVEYSQAINRDIVIKSNISLNGHTVVINGA